MKSVHKGLARGALALYGVQIFRKIIPLISLPYLARILGPSGWGLIAYVTSFSEMLSLVFEFGFNLSATRDIARHREDRERCAEIVRGVVGAQIVLVALGLGAALIVSRFLPLLHDRQNMLLAGCLYALVQGIAPLWLFQGLERMRLVAVLEISGKVASLAGLLLFVHSPEDSWKVLVAYTVPPALTCAMGFWLAHQAVPLRWPTVATTKDALRAGWPLFVFRSGESLYGVANAFTLGLFASAEAVGYYVAAEKLSRAAFGLLNPIREVLYPRLSKLFHESPEDGARLARTGVAVMCTGGVLIGLTLELFAAPLIRLTAGAEFGPAVAVLRILAALPVILSITYSVGMQTLLPHGRDKTVSAIILFAGGINIVLAVLLAPRFAQGGMAAAVVVSEISVMTLMIRAVVKSGLFRWGPPAGALASTRSKRTALQSVPLRALTEEQL